MDVSEEKNLGLKQLPKTVKFKDKLRKVLPVSIIEEELIFLIYNDLQINKETNSLIAEWSSQNRKRFSERER